MKKTLVCCALADPWLAVTENLKKSNQLDTVYWIGWPEDKAKIELSEGINCTFHNINEAWKGIFPVEDELIHNSQLDGFELVEYSSEELMAIKMLERLDPDQKSFSFNERKDFFRHLLRAWLNILDEFEIEIVISPSIPHRVFDYALYVATKIRNIKFVSFKMTVWPGHIIPLEDIHQMPEILVNSKSSEIDSQIDSYIAKINSSYKSAQPDYMKKQEKDASKNTIKRVLGYLRKYNVKAILNLFQDMPIYWKKKDSSIEKTRYLKIEYFYEVIKGFKFKKELNKYYEQICDDYNKSRKFIFVALHYQPEETSCPSGKVFVDQLLMIESLLKYLPKDVFIYVKEHTSQFNPKMEGQTGRYKEFYDSLKKFDRVKLISTKINSFELIDRSIAISTLTGTVGIEALIRRKCAVVFGTAWYEKITGVFKINTRVDLIDLYNNLQEYEHNKELLRAELNALKKSTIKAYHYKGVKQAAELGKEETINNLTNYFIKSV